MIYNSCGKEINDNAKFCDNCGNKTENIISENGKKNDNTLIGEKYKFRSGGGIHLFSTRFTRVDTCVTIEEDKLNIEIEPKNYSTGSEAYFSDITDIKVKSIIAKAYLVCTIIAAIYALVSPMWFFAVPLCIWLGYNKKIIICQRNKRDICIYTSSKNGVEEFISDVKSSLIN